MIVERLRVAEEQVASTAEFIARQRELIAQLQKDGHATTSAGALLTEFLLLQALHEVECKRLSQELAEHDSVRRP